MYSTRSNAKSSECLGQIPISGDKSSPATESATSVTLKSCSKKDGGSEWYGNAQSQAGAESKKSSPPQKKSPCGLKKAKAIFSGSFREKGYFLLYVLFLFAPLATIFPFCTRFETIARVRAGLKFTISASSEIECSLVSSKISSSFFSTSSCF